MKTATIRQVRHDFGTVLDWVGEGEQVQISKRGKIVTLLSPPPAIKPFRARKRPDLVVFRKEINAERRKAASLDVESDLEDGILVHVTKTSGQNRVNTPN